MQLHKLSGGQERINRNDDRAAPREPIIELRGLTKSYQEGERERVVLHDVSLSIERGEFIVLLGRSGSGKSTLLNLISGIDLPTTGEVLIDSTNLTHLSERGRTLFRRKHIGFVFQFFNLIPTLTVEENLLLPLELNGQAGKQARQTALETLDMVGLADRAKDFTDRLSGGEQQRIAIARAIVHAPPLILADEPTGNLDAETGRLVIDLLEGLTRQGGKTMLVATHSAEIAALADRVFTIDGGGLLERSPGVAT